MIWNGAENCPVREQYTRKGDVMKVGDKIKFDFAGKKKEGVICKVSPNSVHLRVDFERQKGKLVKRKLSEIGQGKSSGKVTKKKAKAKTK